MKKSSRPKAQFKPIAVVGMACIFPKAPDLKGFWNVLRVGRDTISEIPETHWKPEDYFNDDPKRPDMTYCRRGGFIDPYPFDPTEFSLPPTVLEATDTSQLLGLVVAKAALEDAGYDAGREFDRDRTSVILGVTGTLELVVPLGARLGHPIWRRALLESGVDPDIAEEVVSRIAEDYVPWQENSFPGLLGNVVAGRIANRLDLHGTNCVVDAACASTLSAAHMATMELEAGRTDMVVTGGVDTFNDIFMYMCFSKTPALSASGKIRPFSDESDGTLLGEGIGMVVLKRLEDAERDGDRVYCVIRGMGTSSDGSQKAVYAPYSPGQARALRRAYEQSAIEPSTVTLVEAHGTGTKVGDVVEFEALKAVYQEASDAKGWCALGTVKSQIGHTKAAAGAAGLIKAALALHHKVLPPTINVDRANPKLGLEDSPFYLNTEARPWLPRAEHPRRAALSSFGFGGSNYHLVLEEHGDKRAGVAWDGSVEILAWSGRDRQELLRKLEAEGSLARIAWESRKSFDPAAPVRLVMVAGPETFHERLAEARAGLSKGEAPSGADLFFGEGPVPGPVAFMFPGQGSQYVGMARELACLFPEVMESLESIDPAVAARIFPPPALSAEAKKAQQKELTSTDVAQPALGAISRGMLAILDRFGLAPEFTFGHSYGELCALYAAGRIDAAALVELSALRGRLMAGQGEDLGTMLAVTGPLDKVGEALKEEKLDLVLANRNSPTQGVLSGARTEIDKAKKIMKARGFTVVPLQVGAAFHSPLVAGAAKPFRKAMEKLDFGKGRLPVYANTTADVYPKDAGKSRDLLANQLAREVDFVGMVENVYKAGARVFVEVGPKQVLTRLVGAILGQRPHQAVALDGSQGKGSSLTDLARALAQLAALGLKVDLGQWEAEPAPERKKRMEVKLVGANYRSPRQARPPRPRPAAVAPKAAEVKAPEVKAAAAPKAPAPAPTPAPVPAPAPVVDTGVFQEAFRSVQSSLAAMQTLAQQTAEAHQRFLEGQEMAQRTFNQMVEEQQRLVQRMLGQPGSMPSLPAVAPRPAPAPQLAPPAPRMAPAAPVAPAPVPAPAPVAAPKPAPAPAPKPAPRPAPAAPSANGAVSRKLLEVVADKTGYPTEMLTLEMDLEADLGIDSIKRVEILAAMEEAVPGLPRVEPDRMGSLRTLAQVVEALGAPAAAAPTPAPDAGVSRKLLEVVADKTGYPTEMLNLEMDLEADLGIDSIKRVEILAAMEEAVPNLPKVEPDRMGSLRTLAQVVEALGAPAPAPAAVPVQQPDGTVSRTLLEVVADKTGYPTDMLNLEMDLEADLGIDSIKRVEILAAMEEAVPNLPKVEPDRMGSLRTLAQVVEALSSGPMRGAAAAPSATPAAAPGGEVARTLMEVVAEKTGYPTDMLNLEMDLEADLGIDSIKRVEILAAMEEVVPNLPKVEPDRMGSLRTLAQVVEALSSGSTRGAPPTAPSATPAAAPRGDVAGKLMEVVAEKTGYPTDMLNLEMDLEADLGIDSIKRVEILAAMEEAVPNLPKVEPDRMGSLRTLAQVVEALSSGRTSGAVPAAAGPAPASAGLEAALLEVVSEKTGYPTDMLNLDMDLEADLGIDSIKRVEILASMEERKPDIARVAPDSMGSLRSLREVLAALSRGGTPAPTPVAAPTPPTTLERRVLRLQPLEAGQPQALPRGKVLVAEDRPGLGKSLVKALSDQGVEAALVGEAISDKNFASLILVANGGTWEESERFLKRAFSLVQQAAPGLRQARGLLATVTRMDGAFGLEGGSFDPVAGGLAGLPKTVVHEWPEVSTRALDLHPDLDAEAVLLELNLEGPTEVALSPAGRRTVVPVLEAAQKGRPVLSRNDLVLVTGGARGVTAHTAIELARAYQPTLVLLGRSPAPVDEPAWLSSAADEPAMKRAILAKELGNKATPAELEQAFRRWAANREVAGTLAAIEQAGSRVVYRSLDVRDAAQVKKLVGELRKEFGPVRGLVHAAGVLADRRIEDKRMDQFESVFDTKVQGLHHLLGATNADELRALVLFSSVTARFGRPGQVDYCMANEVLNKVAQLESHRRDCRVVSLNWGPWEGGMVTPGLKKEFERLGVGLIPLEAGARVLVDELAGAGNDVEVLVGDGFPVPEGTRAPAVSRNGKSALTPVLSKQLSTEAFPFLTSHVIGGRPVLPMALMLEWFGHAAMHGNIGLRFAGVDQLKVFKGLTLEQGEPTVTVLAGTPQERDGKTLVEVELRSGDTLHARATVLMSAEEEAAPEPPVEEAALSHRSYPHTAERIYDELLFHGSHFQGIVGVQGISEQGLVAELQSAPRPAKWVTDPVRSDWLTDPLVLDCVLQLGILWCIDQLGKPSLPSSGGSYRQYKRKFPRKGTRALLQVVEHTPHRLKADVWLVDPKGKLVASYQGLEWTADANLKAAFRDREVGVGTR